MLFTPTDKTSGMHMSVERIYVPYSKLVKFLGPPHKTNKGDQRVGNLGYITEAHWTYRFFDIPFQIRYDSSDFLHKELLRKKEMGKDISGSHKIPPLEDVTYGEILGNRKFVQNIVRVIIHHEGGYESIDSRLQGVVWQIFYDQMEIYK